MRASLSTWFTKRAYFPLLDWYKRIPFDRAWNDALANERLPPEALVDLSTQRLGEALAYAKANVPYYETSFAHAPPFASGPRLLEQLASLPMLEKSHVFENRTALRSRTHRGPVITGTTSGSTGIALTYDHDPNHYAWVEAVQCRGRRWWGVERGDSSVVLWSRPVDGSRRSRWKAIAKYRLRNCAEFDTFQEFDDAAVQAILAAIRRWQPRLVYGYGSSVGRLGMEMKRRGVRLREDERPALVEYTADHMYATERAVTADAFGAPVTSAYGSSECASVAVQCRAGRMHMAIDHTVVEFVREDGTPAAPEETASIVLTQLHNRVMPLIRFKVGDLGSYSTERCPCGSSFPVMNLEVGKVADLISTSSKKNVSAHLLDYVNLYLMKEGIRGVRQFLVEQMTLDDFRLSIVKDSVFEERAPVVFIDRMREYLGSQIRVDVAFVDEIPLQRTGKRRYFIRRFAEDARA